MRGAVVTCRNVRAFTLYSGWPCRHHCPANAAQSSRVHIRLQDVFGAYQVGSKRAVGDVEHHGEDASCQSHDMQVLHA
jgi:hypothetical protein